MRTHAHTHTLPLPPPPPPTLQKTIHATGEGGVRAVVQPHHGLFKHQAIIHKDATLTECDGA